MDILDEKGVRKLSANVFLKVNYSFSKTAPHNFLLKIRAKSFPPTHFALVMCGIVAFEVETK